MRHRYVLFACLLILSTAPCVLAKPRVEHGRYYSPDGEFSLSMVENYHVSKEYSDSRVTMVDWTFVSGIVHGFEGVRSVEWLKLKHPVAKAQYEELARAIVDDNKAKRFREAGFAIREAQLLADEKIPAYVFVAAGRCRGSDCGWHGIILFYGDRVALVSEFASPSGISYFGLTSPATLGFGEWADSLTREVGGPKP